MNNCINGLKIKHRHSYKDTGSVKDVLRMEMQSIRDSEKNGRPSIKRWAFFFFFPGNDFSEPHLIMDFML